MLFLLNNVNIVQCVHVFFAHTKLSPTSAFPKHHIKYIRLSCTNTRLIASHPIRHCDRFSIVVAANTTTSTTHRVLRFWLPFDGGTVCLYTQTPVYLLQMYARYEMTVRCLRMYVCVRLYYFWSLFAVIRTCTILNKIQIHSPTRPHTHTHTQTAHQNARQYTTTKDELRDERKKKNTKNKCEQKIACSDVDDTNGAERAIPTRACVCVCL